MCRHHYSVNRYGVSVSQMTADMFLLSLSQFGAFLNHDLLHVCNKSNMTGATSRTDLPSVFSGVRFACRSFVFCVMFCRSLFVPFVPFFLVIALYVHRFTASGYPFVCLQACLTTSMYKVVVFSSNSFKFLKMFQ